MRFQRSTVFFHAMGNLECQKNLKAFSLPNSSQNYSGQDSIRISFRRRLNSAFIFFHLEDNFPHPGYPWVIPGGFGRKENLT
jgi:hypothetical protein